MKTQSTKSPSMKAPNKRAPNLTSRERAYAAQARLSTPLGPVTVVATDAGVAGLWFDAQAHHPGPIDAPSNPRHPHLTALATWLDAYFERGRDMPRDALPLDPRGTDFQRSVWRALLAIESGHTTTYGEIASTLGSPSASRAVGGAVGRNPIGIVVPCHRVIGRDGSLTGYAGGTARKQALLELEAGAGGRGQGTLPLVATELGSARLRTPPAGARPAPTAGRS
jgi:methylated-DNA-[protein]-cysteine S-methyltransferase